MRSIPSKVLVAVLVVSAFSAVAVASASASEFVFSKTGALKGSALSLQVFESPAAGNWECSKEKITGNVTALKTTKQKVTVQYEGCKYFGLLLKAEPAEFEMNTNGSDTLLKNVAMSGFACTINFKHTTVSKLTYANKPAGKIDITAALNNLISFGIGSGCPYAEEANTRLKGESLLELEGGTAEVK